MSADNQQYKEEKSTLMRQALPNGTVLHSGIHEYKIVQVLGAGGFGITYKVSANLQVGNVTVNSYLVIKEHFLKGCWRDRDQTNVLHAPTMESDLKQSRKDFIEEAKRLNRIGQKTPHIVKVNETFEANNTAYYVMEYLDGGDLQHYISRHGPMPEEKAVKTIVTIAQAVALLHDSHLLHLDIKPDNIVLKTDPESKQQIPVLIDFGIAKHFDKSGKPTSHLVAKGASEGYAPMEQYDEISHFAPEIDVYALGATLYFLLTGKQPLRAFNIHSFNDLQSNLPSSLSTPTVGALRSAMQPSRFERTSSALQFIKDLQGKTATGNDTEPFRKPNPVPKPRPHSLKNLLIMGATCAAVVLFFYLKPETTHESIPFPPIEVDTVSAPKPQEPNKASESTPKVSADETHKQRSEISERNTPAKASQKTPEEKRTPKAEETDEQKYARAVASGDISALEKLAGKGFAKAYPKLATLYLDERKYDQAASYAQKAYSAGIGKKEAVTVMRKLHFMRYYDDKELPAALK